MSKSSCRAGVPVTFQIPVYPLVRKFLAYHYDVEPFMLTTKGNCQKNTFAAYLYASLDRYNHFDTRIPVKYPRLTEQLTVGVGKWVQSYGAGMKLTPAKVGAFNDFVRQRFFENLTHEVVLRTALGMGVKTATLRFLNRYGLTEDELPLEIALRYYARYRRNLLIELCPELPGYHGVNLPHERDTADGQMESGRRPMA